MLRAEGVQLPTLHTHISRRTENGPRRSSQILMASPRQMETDEEKIAMSKIYFKNERAITSKLEERDVNEGKDRYHSYKYLYSLLVSVFEKYYNSQKFKN